MAPIQQFAFDEQINSPADAVRDVLSSVEVPQLDAERPVILSGIGTSLHACKVAGYWAAALSAGRIRPIVVESHEYALRGGYDTGDRVVVVSHRGTKRFPRQVLDCARAAGALTIAVSGRGAEDPGGDIVLRTCADERANRTPSPTPRRSRCWPDLWHDWSEPPRRRALRPRSMRFRPRWPKPWRCRRQQTRH